MPLNPNRVLRGRRSPGRRPLAPLMKRPQRRSTVGRRLQRAVFAALLLAVLLLASVASAHGERTHWLEDQRLCVDPTSVLLLFDEVQPTRAEAARANLFASLGSALRGSLQRARVDADFSGSCVGRDGYVLVSIWIRFLDPNVYASHRYGDQAFGLTLSVQTGRHASGAYFAEHYVLPEMTFNAFEEVAYSEIDRGAQFENHVRARADALIQELVDAWHEDNP